MKNDFVKFLEEMGIIWKYLLNGLIGGVVWSIYKKLNFLAAVRQIVIGSFVAGYLTPLIAFKQGIPVEYISALSFLVGMLGMVIIDTIYTWIINKVKQYRKYKDFKGDVNVKVEEKPEKPEEKFGEKEDLI